MTDQPMPPGTEKIWTAMGLSPQVFPIYYPMGDEPFTSGQGVQSGAVGARARLQRPLSNFPHMFMGLRISNVYDLFADTPQPTAQQVELARYLREWTDNEQTVTITLAQQNITAELLYQPHLTGHDGINWAPFPAPFPMAGGNNIEVTVSRVSSYPQFNDAEILPTCTATIVAAVLRADLRSSPPRRVHQPY